MTWETIATVATAIFGSQVLGNWVTGYFSKKKVDADAATMTVDSILKWATELTKRIEALEKALNERDDEIMQLRQKLAHLEAEMLAYEHK